MNKDPRNPYVGKEVARERRALLEDGKQRRILAYQRKKGCKQCRVSVKELMEESERD